MAEENNHEFLSLLFKIINCNEHWRLIRWCDQGKAFVIPNPRLFEKELLRKESLFLKASTFPSFVDQLLLHGFTRVTAGSRPERHMKFKHPSFQTEGTEPEVKARVLTAKKSGDHGASCTQNQEEGFKSTAYVHGEAKRASIGSVAGINSTVQIAAQKGEAQDHQMSMRCGKVTCENDEHKKGRKRKRDRDEADDATSPAHKRPSLGAVAHTSPPFPHDKYCLPQPTQPRFTLQDPTPQAFVRSVSS